MVFNHVHARTVITNEHFHTHSLNTSPHSFIAAGICFISKTTTFLVHSQIVVRRNGDMHESKNTHIYVNNPNNHTYTYVCKKMASFSR